MSTPETLEHVGDEVESGPPVLDDDGKAGKVGESQARLVWRRFGTNKLALISLYFIGLLILTAIFAPLVATHDPIAVDVTSALLQPGEEGHILGTDPIGRDVFSRLIYGLRTALIVGFVAELAALALAIVIGLVAGYVGGRAEQLLMGFTDVMYAFPGYLFAVIMVTVMGRSVLAVILAITVASWVGQARLVRAQTLSLKSRDFIEAARSMGAGGPRVAVRYILPNAMGPILVATSFGIPGAIATEAGLSLLGLGVAPPTPSWGAMLTEGIQYTMVAPHLMLAPAVLFALTLLAFNWVGDGVREAFDTTGVTR
ncbi:ABC transporter permease [Propionibacteriaceae bacterium Y2011]